MIVGDKINYLTLIKITEKKQQKSGNKYGLFRCDCGTEKEIRINAVTTNSTKSCGCHRRKTAKENAKSVIKHNKSYSREYAEWQKIKTMAKKYNTELCEDWKNFQNFYDWLVENNFKYNGVIQFTDIYAEYNSDNASIKYDTQQVRIEHNKQVCQNKYGCDHYMKDPKLKAKYKKGIKDKFGVECVLSLPSVQDKIEKTNIKKYGAKTFSCSEQGRELARQRAIKTGLAKNYNGKSIATNAQDIGITSSALSNRIKKYGFDKAIKMDKHNTAIEQSIMLYLASINIEYKKEQRVDKYFPDFILPDYDLIIECDGLYWHSDAKQPDNLYHRNKLYKFEELGYRALFFREDELENKLHIIKSMINNQLGLSTRIFGRKTELFDLDKKIAKDFFNNNHLMGNGQGKTFSLLSEDKVVAAMQIIHKKDILEISRFCNKLNTNVIGGFSKLLNRVKQYYGNYDIGTFIDRRYGQGNYLKDLGFIKENERVSFRWCKDAKTYHRLKFRKNAGYDHRMRKIWDCGQARWVYHAPKTS